MFKHPVLCIDKSFSLILAENRRTIHRIWGFRLRPPPTHRLVQSYWAWNRDPAYSQPVDYQSGW